MSHKFSEASAITIPLHSPLYAKTAMVDYGGEVEGFNILLKLPEEAVREVIAPTPFDYVAPYAIVDGTLYKTLFGMVGYDVPEYGYYRNAGVHIPASYRGTLGSYCANYYKNRDFGMTPGREGAGYPIKLADIRYQHTGRAATVSVECATAKFEASVVTGTGGDSFPADIPISPTLLIQRIPDAEKAGGILLQQVLARDIGASSQSVSEPAEGAFSLFEPASGSNDLEWLQDAQVVAAEFTHGSMRGNEARVLSTEFVGAGLLERIRAYGD